MLKHLSRDINSEQRQRFVALFEWTTRLLARLLLKVAVARKSISKRLPSDCTNMRVTSPKRWKTEWMSALSVRVAALTTRVHTT